MRRASLALALLVGASVAPASAQSKKYPPVAPDKDLEEENRSDLWESALNPDTRPYKDLVKEAQQLIGHNTSNDLRAGLEKLDLAIKKMPSAPDAYLIRGNLALSQKRWSACADDLGAADDLTKPTKTKPEDPTARARMRLDLGVCLARTGRLADAERTLVRATANATAYKGELWMRLGETRIALGKLDEAIDALAAAQENGETIDVTRWLLALAYDRARRPGESQEHAMNAKRYDQTLSLIQAPRQPHLGNGDTEYLYGIAYRYAMSRPEYALIYFRKFLQMTSESPWRRRVEEHVRELTAIKFPSKDTLAHRGSAPIVIDEIRAKLEKPVATMRQCLAKLPLMAYRITITKVGPRSSDARQPMYRQPTAGSTVEGLPEFSALYSDTQVADARHCLVKLADKTGLPAPKERDTNYTVTFYVVGP